MRARPVRERACVRQEVEVGQIPVIGANRLLAYRARFALRALRLRLADRILRPGHQNGMSLRCCAVMAASIETIPIHSFSPNFLSAKTTLALLLRACVAYSLTATS